MFQTSHRERIDALELLGATFVDKKRDLLGALKYWKRAMDLRYIDSNNIVQKPEPKHLIMAYDYAKEVRLMWINKVCTKETVLTFGTENHAASFSFVFYY